MLNVKFYPRDRKAKSESTLNLSINYRGKKIKLSSLIKIHPKLWDSKAQKITTDARVLSRFSSQDPTFSQKLHAINSRLSSIRGMIQDYSIEMALQRKPCDLVDLKDAIKAFVNKTTDTNTDNQVVLDYLDAFILNATSGVTKQINGSNYTKGTINNYRNLRQTIKRFETKMKIRLKWKMINRELYARFMQWQEDENFSVNYRGKHFKGLKALMRMAYDDGIHENQSFRARWFAVPSKRAEKYPLNADEIKAIYDLDLEHGSTHCKSRDLFLIGCFTGLRISDIRRLNHNVFIKNKAGRLRIKIVNKKTKRPVIIPVSTPLHEILRRYDYKCPSIANQTANRLIKQIALEAGIPVKTASKLSLHLGRHSFVTHLYHNEEIPMVDIMQISGHRTERSFMQYVNANAEDSARRMEQNEWFK